MNPFALLVALAFTQSFELMAFTQRGLLDR
jgi:hypothetical protein